MQITVKDIKVKEGTTKSGPNEGKPWKLIILIGQDGTEFTTFDASAQEVGVGGVIELEPIIKAGKINFTDFKIIQKGSFQPSPNGQPDMSKEDWAEKDRLERWSRECNTCFMGIMNVASACVKEQVIMEKTGKFAEAYDAALDYALNHFNGKPVSKSTQKPAPEATKSKSEALDPDLNSITFANAGELKTTCKDLLKMDFTEIGKVTEKFQLNTELGRKDCWANILANRPGAQKAGLDTEGVYE